MSPLIHSVISMNTEKFEENSMNKISTKKQKIGNLFIYSREMQRFWEYNKPQLFD